VVGLPRDISPGARSRRAFFADLLIAIALATLTILLAAGIGVVGFLSLLVLLVLSAWIGLEAAIRSLRRRRHSLHYRPRH
jgi:NhaP-type Na+/H+ or K+/H+ antiporter